MVRLLTGLRAGGKMGSRLLCEFSGREGLEARIESLTGLGPEVPHGH